MKKIVFPMIVALVATFAFVSCTPEPKTDAELTDIIIKNATYVGMEGTDAATLQINSMLFTLSYDELGVFSQGTWGVFNGQMDLTGIGEGNPSGTGAILKDGKELELTFGTLVFKLKVK